MRTTSNPQLRIGLAQVSSGTDPAANLRIIERHVSDASALGVDVVVFPEAMMCRFGVPLAEIAEPISGNWARAVDEIAAEAGVTVVAGMFTPGDGPRVRNTLLITGPETRTHYDKIHLYDAFGYSESDTVSAGDHLVTAEVKGVTIGFATCYDIRFPAMIQELAAAGADLVVVSASWGAGEGKVDQWTLLARARALDSTTFVAACGQADPAASGEINTGTAPLGVGHSLVCDPSGAVVGQLGSGPDLLVADVDTAAVLCVRDSLPVLRNRRRIDASMIGSAVPS